MALIGSAGFAALLFALFLITVAFGSQVLTTIGLVVDQPLDELLLSSGIGFAALQLLAGIISFAAGLTLRSAVVLLVVMSVAGWRGWKSMLRLGERFRKDLYEVFGSSTAKLIGIGTFFFAGLEALLAMAPLTGSDAMHYHFTAPLLELGRPEHPIFWLTHSFFLGLGHELIRLGLVLGGDKLALLMIFMSGCLTGAALLQLARRLMPMQWALSAVLTFFMAPMVFWQIGTAGSPDIWMGFYVLLAALAMEQAIGPASHRWMVLAGVYSGAAASIKYTGWIIPAVIVVCVLWFSKSILWAALSSIAALAAGVFPLLRNFLWTGDPFFPFLNQWIGKVAVNPTALKFIQADVHSHVFSLQPLHVLYFSVTMGSLGTEYGLGNYFGPIVLAFLPLLLFCNWKMRLARVAAALWICTLLANALTTQMARFLLPAYPLVLALVFCGAAAASRKLGNRIRFGCAATLAVFAVFCLASDSLYARDFLPVSLGLESRDAFLDRMAPNYQTSTFINSEMAHREGRVLLFFRHLYYVRIPYMDGSPDSSWLMDPDRLTTPQMLLTFLKQQDVHWVVKAPSYPEELAGVFEECEKEGKLIPEARTEVEDLYGSSRIIPDREKTAVVLLRVASW
jgi:hypothetical protein